MSDPDWARVAVEVAIAALSGFGGALATAWRIGRAGAEDRAALKDELEEKIDALRNDTVGKMDQAIKAADARNELLISQIRETLEGMRRQFDEHRVEIEREFFRRGEFNEFIKAYRDDQNRINDKLDKLLAARR